MKREELKFEISKVPLANCSLELSLGEQLAEVPWDRTSKRVRTPCGRAVSPLRVIFVESGCLGMQPKRGGKFHLRLNIGTRPIANKYREGKMKSTLKRELNST